MRLDKYLAQAQIGMRKVVRGYIREGNVTVNGKVVTKNETEIDEKKDTIVCFGQVVSFSKRLYYMFHKPEGCITARRDARNLTVMDYFKEEDTTGIFPVGRLDKDTEGLLFLTNDGQFDHRLMDPAGHVEKTYFFWAYGTIDKQSEQKLQEGISIAQGEPITKPAKLERLQQGNYSELKDEMKLSNPPHTKKGYYEQPVVSGYLTIVEGRKHQVKRMLKAAGCHVVYLKRIAIGGIMLDEQLEKGQYRLLSEKELQSLIQE